MYRAYKRPFTLDDIPEPSPYDNCDYTVQRLEVMWLHELTRKGPKSASLGWVTWRFMRTRIILASILYILYIVCCFISIGFCMRGLLEYIESEDGSYLVGAKWAVLLTFVELLRVTLYSTVWGINYRTGIRLRSACMTMLYRKILRLTSLGDKSVGECYLHFILQLINLYSNDGQRIVDFILFGPMIIGGPVSMIFCIGYIYWYLSGWAALGMAVFFLFYPIQYGLSRLSGYIKRKALTFTDKRLSFMTELLQTIKIIKLNVWEHFFSKKILDIRKKELRLVRRTAYCQSLSSSMSSTAPVITAIVVFLVHIAAGYSLSASQVPLCSCLFTFSCV
ncbi:hypothetical protein AAG570_003753 [Ranatra chinensis]|uniref:ABC transmembrane type-1 domain-containing protein n=1 Tax=Ranatra chinensis TaxID=642074 RepID=A0ABD0YRB0_9HEMI